MMISFTSYILIGVVVVITYYVVKWLTSKSGPNPFAEDSVTMLKPLETDQKARNKVLKEGFTTKKIPENLDAIVIGSGIGGLSTAAILSKAGKKVLVLEQHDQAGGCCHTFIEKGYEFDVGIHYIGEVCKGHILRTLVDQISDGQIQWSPLDDAFDRVVFGSGAKQNEYDVIGGKGTWEESLIKSFPQEEEGIKKYFSMAQKVKSAFEWMVVLKFLPLRLSTFIAKITKYFFSGTVYMEMSVKEMVNSLVKDEELRTLLWYNFGDYGTAPDKGSFGMQLLLHDHFSKGAYYPYGGASEIAFHIIPVIQRSGGKVLCRAPVKNIMIGNDGKACGVIVQKGSEDHKVFAPVIISAVGVHTTFQRLLPPELAQKSFLWDVNKKLSLGPGAMNVFLGLKGTAKELGLKAENVWYHSSPKSHQEVLDYMNLSVDDAINTDVPLLFISFPSAKDPSWESRYPGTSNCTIVTFGSYEWFRSWENEQAMKRGHDYEAIKNAIGQRMIDKTCQLFPSIKDHIEYINIASPVSNNYYIGADKGEIYGYDHDFKRFSREMMTLLRPKLNIDGLYLSGQDMLSGGFGGAIMSGVFTASAVLGRQVYIDLMKLHKQLKTKDKTL